MKLEKIRRILKYAKPYKVTLLMIIICLLMQQVCSFLLPMFMSDIVDVGVRQYGIENAYPEAMSINAHDVLTSFMEQREKDLVNSSYIFIDKDNIEKSLNIDNPSELILKINILRDKYKYLNDEDIYILKDLIYPSGMDLKELDGCFINSLNRLVKYLNYKNQDESQNNNLEDTLSFDFLELYKMIDEFKSLTSYDLSELDKKDIADFDSYRVSAHVNKEIYEELQTDVFKIQSSYIMKIGKLMIIVTIISILFTILENYFSSKMSAGISLNIREDVFKKVESLGEKEVNKISVSSLITRTINDISQLKGIIIMGVQMIVPPIMLIGGLIMAFRKSISMSFIIFLSAVIASGIVITVFVVIFPKAKLMQKLLDKFNLIVRQKLNGLMIIKSFGNLDVENKKFDKCNREFSDISSFINRVIMYVTPLLTITMNMFSLVIIWVGADKIANAQMQVGDLMAFIQYSSMVVGAFLMIVMLISYLPHSFISVDRVFEVLDMESSVKDPQKPKSFKKDFKGEICFNNVSFSYENGGNFALKDINFSAKCGQIVSIIGSTGSGKSTLVSLIPRFYDVTCGEILIDGINVKDVTQFDLRQKISYVPQKSILFTGSVDYNLRYGIKNVDEDRVKICAKAAELSNILENDGINKKASQEGRNFSGGQRQRICIARALIKNTPIYIFDDSFSALDFKTELLIRKKIFKLAKDALIILVSQRIGTVMNSDKIIVLDRGKIVGEGTHETLLKTCKAYMGIADSQLPKEVMI